MSHGTSASEPSGQSDLLYDLDAVEQVSGLLLGQHRRLAALDEEHANRRQMLLDGRPGCSTLSYASIAWLGDLQRFDIGRDMEWLDIGEFADVVLVEPTEDEQTAR
jgi:hypothetical protein